MITSAQFRKSVGADLAYAWFPVGERPTVDVSASRSGINLLGPVTEDGETMFLECDGPFTKEVTVRFLETLQTKSGEELIVVLDKGSYFTANKVREFVEKSKIELLYLPTGIAKLNPTEECWRQLRLALGNRFFGSVDELRTGIRSALETINPLGIY